MEEQFNFQWNDYKNYMTGSLKGFIQDEDFVDVTLHAEGKTLKAHRMYLCACSSYFAQVLKGTSMWQLPVLFLTNVPFVDLQKILEFVYCGEVQITRSGLQSFLKSADILKINGLVNGAKSSSLNLVGEADKTSELHSNRPPKKKKRKSPEMSCDPLIEVTSKTNLHLDNDMQTEMVEHVTVKADPEDFQSDKDITNEDGSNRGIGIRSDLTNWAGDSLQPGTEMYGERGRCHFCSLLCPDRSSLTLHLTEAHQPPKHSLCENCENFFHICAIQRHRLKCKARYHTDHKQ